MTTPTHTRCPLHLALACTLSTTACTSLCQGPGCEASFGSARLSWVAAAAGDDLQLPGSGLEYDGGVAPDEGARWSAAFLDGDVVIGQPDAERVVVVSADPFVGGIAPTLELTSQASDFGAAVLVHPRGTTLDLWVGAPAANRSRGAVHIFRDVRGLLANGASDPPRASVTLVGQAAADQLGATLVGCPDLTGDGEPDVLLGAPMFAAPVDGPVGPFPRLAGVVFLIESEKLAAVQGDVSPWEVGRGWWGEFVGDGAGTGVACDAEIFVGAPWRRDLRGRVYVLGTDPLPESGPLEDRARVKLSGRDADSWTGVALAALQLGGERHLAVGEAGVDSGVGRVTLYRLRDVGSPLRVASFVQDPGHGFRDHLGRALYSGDLDGDGQGDLIVASPDYRVDVAGFDVGRMWVWFGSGSAGWVDRELPANGADAVIRGTQSFLRVGRRAHVGDPDGDGVDELLVPTRAPTLEPLR